MTGLPLSAPALAAMLARPSEILDRTRTQELRRRVLGALQSAVPTGVAGRRLIVDRFALGGQLPDPAPFRWTGYRARRAVGMEALRCLLAGRASSPAAAVSATVEAMIAGVGPPSLEGRSSLAGWVAALPAAGRAAVEAEATTWVLHLLGAFEWGGFAAPLVVGPADRWWNLPSRPGIALHGRWDVTIPGEAIAPEVTEPMLVTMLGGTPGPAARAELGLAPLLCLLGDPAAPLPARTVAFWPASGRVRAVPVDSALMLGTAAAVASAIRAGSGDGSGAVPLAA